MTSCMNPARPRIPVNAVVGVLALLASSSRRRRAPRTSIQAETGSTLIYPLFNVWVSEYTKTHPGVHLTTGSTGSGAGIEQAISGAAQIGASDAYMSDAQIKGHPQIINVPMAISALTVNYNLPGLNAVHLKLDGPVLADIYTGKIRAWDDKAIAAPKPGPDAAAP